MQNPGLIIAAYWVMLVSGPAMAAPTVEQTTIDSLIERAKQADLAHQKPWLKLVHYEKSWLGAWTSQVAGQEFFASPAGKVDPEAELEATLRGFFVVPSGAHSLDPKKTETHPQCHWPARLIYLKRALEMETSQLPSIMCKDYSDYRQALDTESVSLVFSSFYINGPSSAFGHTLFRLQSRDHHHELLDHGVSFAAVATTTHPITYALFGLSGQFRGIFTSVPYYYKVREYSDFEARDLWSYDLALTPDELELLVAHLWELEHTYYRYFYFTQNCSYHLFTTLEAAAPRLDLVERQLYYVIPSDSVRTLMSVPGLVQGISYRPSIRTIFEHRLHALNENQVITLRAIVKDQNLESIDRLRDPQQKAQVLDAALDEMEFKHPDDGDQADRSATQYKQRILAERATLGVKSKELHIDPPMELAPHLGHPVRRLTAEGGTESSSRSRALGGYTELGMRFAMNDLLDPGPGYPTNSQVELFNFKARYYLTSKRFELDEASIVRVTSLSPIREFERNLSFDASIAAQTIHDRRCDRCVAGVVAGGPGAAWQPFASDRLTVFGLVDAQAAYSPAFYTSSFNLGVGPTVGATFLLTQNLKGILSSLYRFQFFSSANHSDQAQAELRWAFIRDVALNLRATRYMNSSEGAGALIVYF